MRATFALLARVGPFKLCALCFLEPFGPPTFFAMTISIIGLGLIGGSFAKDLRAAVDDMKKRLGSGVGASWPGAKSSTRPVSWRTPSVRAEYTRSGNFGSRYTLSHE